MRVSAYLVIPALAAISAAAPGPVVASTTAAVTVTASIPSATYISTDPSGAAPAGNCMSVAAGRTAFGAVLPGTSSLTAQDCSIVFGSSNDTAMLLASQSDAGGSAMVPGASSGVVGQWPLNGTGADLSSGGNPVILPLSPKNPGFAAGPPRYGQSLGFDGDDTASISYAAAYDLDVFTVDLWFKTSNVANGLYPVLIDRGQCSVAPCLRNFILFFDHNAEFGPADQLCADTTSNNGTLRNVICVPPGLADGSWHHVALVLGADNVERLYVDGSQGGSRPFSGNPDNPALDIALGNEEDQYWSHFVGSIDEVRISSTARSADEIRSYYGGAVADYSDAANDDWSTAGKNLFGACLRAARDGAMVDAGTWLPQAACLMNDGAYWNSIPASTPTKIAFTSTGDTDAAVDLRFGLRTAPGQVPGSYLAPILFTVAAPNLL